MLLTFGGRGGLRLGEPASMMGICARIWDISEWCRQRCLARYQDCSAVVVLAAVRCRLAESKVWIDWSDSSVVSSPLSKLGGYRLSVGGVARRPCRSAFKTKVRLVWGSCRDSLGHQRCERGRMLAIVLTQCTPFSPSTKPLDPCSKSSAPSTLRP